MASKVAWCSRESRTAASLMQPALFLTASREPELGKLRLVGDGYGCKNQNPRWTGLRNLGEVCAMGSGCSREGLQVQIPVELLENFTYGMT